MKGCIFNEQRIIQTTGYVFWAIQLTRNILENDEQYFPEVTT